MSSRKDRNFSKFSHENPNVYDENGNFVDWRKHFRNKDNYLQTYYEVVPPLEFIKDVLPKEYLDVHKSKEEIYPLIAYYEGTFVDEGLHTGKGTGILKYALGVNEKGRPITKTIPVYDDYRGIELTQDNRFALINMCTYFGRNIYQKVEGGRPIRVRTRIPSLCFGLAIDLDYVQLGQLERLFGKIENDIVPNPTYIVNSGAGIHLYYLFEQPIPLKDLTVQRYLGELKKQLTIIIWDNETSLGSHRQYQGIYQDMRVPGSWTKFGYLNKKTCSYIINAYKVGDKVDFTYLERFVDTGVLPKVDDEGSLATKKLTLEECAVLYPKWYDKYVIRGEYKPRQHYTQNRGLYEWWKDLITRRNVPSSDTSHEGNRFFCIRILFVMAKKAGVPFEEVMDDAMGLIPFMNSRNHNPSNEFTQYDVLVAAKFYEDEYTQWSNQTLKDQTGIDVEIYKKSRRNGRTRKQHLEIARATQKIVNPNWRENNGRPKGSDKSSIVREWREKNPKGKKCDCIKETGLTKPTVYKWWNQRKPTKTNEK